VLCECHNPKGDAWLLGPDDYACNDLQAFPWNDFERQSLECVADDPIATDAIRRFWDSIRLTSFSEWDERAALEHESFSARRWTPAANVL